MRFGVLGTGHWAAKTQGIALAAHPEAELVGVWGRDPDKAAARSLQWGLPVLESSIAFIDGRRL